MLPITAIVTAFRRPSQTVATIQRIQACQPAPAEILVYVNGNDPECLAALRAAFVDLPILGGAENIGPGGSRNELIRAASHEIVAAFDDDSYPMDADYFARVQAIAEQYPQAAVIGATITHRHESPKPAREETHRSACYVGCGAIYRRSAFLATRGFVPVPLAYAVEEADLALQLHAQGKEVYRSQWLRVFHDTDLTHRESPAITSASVTNLALLAFLRYPPALWPYGAAQTLNRVRWLYGAGQTKGILSGLLAIPAHLFKYRTYRNTLPLAAIRSYRQLRD